MLVATCLRNPTRDPQLEGGLEGWLLDVADDGGAREAVRRAVLDAASRTIANRRDRRQIASILASLALDGDRAAARVLLRMIDVQPPGDDVACSAIWGLGEPAWRRVIRSYGRRWKAARRFDWGWIVQRARDELRPRRMLAVLLEETTDRGAFLELAAVVELQERRIRARSPEVAVDASLDSLERIVRSPLGRRAYHDLGAWGRQATPADRAEAWRRLVSETDARRIVRRLWALRRRRPPALHPRLLKLARHPVRLVRVNVAGTLGQFKDERVRRLALRMLRDDPVRALDGDALWMLERNARDEDAAAVDAALPRRASREVRDAWVSGVKSIVDPSLRRSAPRRSPVWTPLLLRATEVTPCRECRATVLRLLVERGAAPEAMLEEALFDANEDARETARDALRKLSP